MTLTARHRFVRLGVACSLLVTFLSVVYQSSFFTLYYSHSYLPDFRRDNDVAAIAGTSPSRNITESFVISFDPENVRRFVERNRGAGVDPVLWAPAVDGFHQRNLDVWAQLSGLYPPLNASAFSAKDKGAYASPHAVGCYLAHWNVLRSLAHRPAQLRPEAYFVFEDDTSCAPNLVKHVLDTIRQLPENWDMLFVGGKPFSYFKSTVDMSNVSKYYINGSSPSTLRRDVCRGDFGRAEGPLAPDGSRVLSEDDQPYWQTKYTTNTDAYVINPRRVRLLLENHLHPHRHAPVDIVLADLMAQNQIQAFMTTRMWCRQQSKQSEKLMEVPGSWNGYFGFMYEPLVQVHPALLGKTYVWQNVMRLENCTL